MADEQDIEEAVEKYIGAFEKLETAGILDLIRSTFRHGVLVGVKLVESKSVDLLKCPSCGEMSVMFLGHAENAHFECSQCSDSWGPNDFPDEEG